MAFYSEMDTGEVKCYVNMMRLYEISGCHCGDNMDVGLQGCNVVWTCR
jgi:hypothetical protein